MKYIFLFLLLPFFLIGQTEPFKNCNTIEIYVSTDPVETYKEVGQMLLVAGYSLRLSDPVLFNLSTEEKGEAPGIVARFSFTIFKDENGSKIVLRGEYINTSFGPPYDVIDNRGQKNSPANKSWKALERMAERVAGTRVYKLL